MLSLRSTLVAGAAALALAPAAAHAGVTSGAHTVASYDFFGTYASSLGTAGPATPLGSTHAFDTSQQEGQTVGHLHTGALSGVAAPIAGVPATSYSIAMTFRLTDVDGRNRVLGFKSPAVDDGIYVVDGKLVFDDGATDIKPASSTPIAANAWTHLVVTRTATGLVRLYVNDDLEIDFSDPQGDLVLSGQLRAFQDDNMESAAADIARLQLFDGPLSPNEATGMYAVDGLAPVAEVLAPAAYEATHYVGRDTYGTAEVSDDGTQKLPVTVRLEKLNGDVVASSKAVGSAGAGPFAGGATMTGIFNYAFLGAPVVDGEPYNLVVESSDMAGNSSETVRAARGDTTPPTGLTIAEPDGSTTDRTPDVVGTLPASKREATFTVARVCKDEGCGYGSFVGAVPVWPTGGTYRTELLADGNKPLPDGSYLVKVTSCDSAENCQVATKPFRIGLPAAPTAPAVSQPVVVPPAVTPRAAHAQIRPLRDAVLKALRKQRARRMRAVKVAYTAPVAGTAKVSVLAGRRVVASGAKTYATPGRSTIVVKARRKVPRKVTVRVTFAPRGGQAVTSSARVTLKRG